MNDGIIAQDVNVFSNEVRIPVEVWKDDKMLFPTYDESVPGRNLLSNSKGPYSVGGNGVAESETVKHLYNIVFMNVEPNKKYTFSAKSDAPIWGTIAGIHSAECFLRVGSYHYRFNSDIYVFSGNINGSGHADMRIDSNSGDKVVNYWNFKIEYGDNPNPVWTPAPEELLELATIHPVNCSYRIDGNEIILSDFTENRGYVDIEISYGEGWTRTKRVNFHRKNRIQDIQVKGKRPYRAYLGNNLIWHKYHERTQAIFDYANDRYFHLPTNRIAYDDYIRGLLKNGLLDKLDLHYIFSGDGDTNFKLINVVNPGTYNGTAFGGLEWSNEGVKGNGVNGYVDTNFNPALLVEGQRYQGLDAAMFSTISTTADTDKGRIIMGNGMFNNEYQLRNHASSTNLLNTYDNKLSYHAPFSGVGFKCIVRIGGTINCTDKDTYYPDATLEKPDSVMLRRGISVSAVGGTSRFFGELQIMMSGVGASLTYEETQQFRQLFNKYLKSNNLQEIA